MKIATICPECSFKGDPPDFSFYRVAILDGGFSILICKNNHRSVIIYHAHKYQILFELAAYAILDGYYREAVTSFAASLERFYEFYLRVIFHRRKKSDNFDAFWKKISFSERQFGAFASVYTLELNEPPIALDDIKFLSFGSASKFRNSIVHRGEIPTREQAERFGEIVRSLIRTTLQTLYEDDSERIFEYWNVFDDKKNQLIRDYAEKSLSWDASSYRICPQELAISRVLFSENRELSEILEIQSTQDEMVNFVNHNSKIIGEILKKIGFGTKL